MASPTFATALITAKHSTALPASVSSRMINLRGLGASCNKLHEESSTSLRSALREASLKFLWWVTFPHDLLSIIHEVYFLV